MRILIVGGIFDKSAEYRAAHKVSPETVLADGLAAAGCDVSVQGHRAPLSQERFDVVHIHHFARAAWRMLLEPRRCPFVFTSHDPFLLQQTLLTWKLRLLAPAVLRRADGLVALSRREADLFTTRYGIAPERIHVIPNGIPQQFHSANDGDTAGKDLLFVGQLQPFKGLDWLLEAMPEIRARHPQVKLRLCYQTGALLHQYRARAAQLGVADCVIFEGPRSPEQLAGLYRSCAIYVHPSLAECLSTVVSEAMWSGACVVATDVGGIREQIDEASGVIVPPRNAKALAVVINGLLDRPEWRRCLGRAARERASERFTVPRMIEKHLEFYRRVLSPIAARGPIPSSLLSGRLP